MSALSERVCPIARCAELNHPDAIVCHACGSRLVPQRRTVERWMRVRAASQWASTDVDLDEHADMIVQTIEGLRPQRMPPRAATQGEGPVGSTPPGPSLLPLPKGAPQVLIPGRPATLKGAA